MATDFYAVLGLPQNATSRQIRLRFLELARERHPDRVRGAAKVQAEEDFQVITQAFNVLSDPVRRRQLDTELARPDYKSASVSPEAAKVYLQRGAKAYRDGSYAAAVENFDSATREDAENAQAWHFLAKAGRRIPSWKVKAREAAARACELEPMNAVYLRLAGDLFHEQGQHAQAAKYYRGAIDWGEPSAELEAAFQTALRAAKQGGA